MSVLLFVVGAIAVMVGVGMVGYGIPINEFSFGNTLIVAGTTAAVGGLIDHRIGAVVGQLQRIAETLATRTPVRSSRPLKCSNRRPARVRPRCRAEFRSRPGRNPRPASVNRSRLDALASADMPVEDHAGRSRRRRRCEIPICPAVVVEEFEVEEYEDVSLSPRQPMPAPAPAELDEPAPAPPVSDNASPVAEKRPEPEFDAPWRSSPPPPPRSASRRQAISMPCGRRKSRPAKRPVVDEAKPEPKPRPWPPAPEAPIAAAKRTAVAILKSGVVDGMGYTLYVDGSIEAELPQGTLRFASINELRDHLAKNS